MNLRNQNISTSIFSNTKSRASIPLLTFQKSLADLLHIAYVDDCCPNNEENLPVSYNANNESLNFYNPTTNELEEISISGGGGAAMRFGVAGEDDTDNTDREFNSTGSLMENYNDGTNYAGIERGVGYNSLRAGENNLYDTNLSVNVGQFEINNNKLDDNRGISIKAGIELPENEMNLRFITSDYIKLLDYNFSIYNKTTSDLTDNLPLVMSTIDGKIYGYTGSLGGGTQDLQSVTENGASTTRSMEIVGNTFPSSIPTFDVYDSVVNGAVSLSLREINGIVTGIVMIGNSEGGTGTIAGSLLTSGTPVYELPDASGTIALKEDLEGYIPLSGTEVGGPVTGDIEVDENVYDKGIYQNYSGDIFGMFFMQDEGLMIKHGDSYLKFTGGEMQLEQAEVSSGIMGNHIYTEKTKYSFAQMQDVGMEFFDTKVANYTLIPTDLGRTIEMNLVGANTVTVNDTTLATLPIGGKINVVQYGAGQITFTATGTAVIISAGGATKTADQYSFATIIKRSATEFYLVGDITT